MLIRSLLAVGAIVVMALSSGCASVRSMDGKVEAKNNSKRSYWNVLGESYQVGGPGVVTQATVLRAPALYMNGILFNDKDREVTFDFSGRFNLNVLVPPKSQVSAQLPPGSYYLRIYLSGSSNPYRSDYIVIDDNPGDSQTRGLVCDWYRVAP